MKLGVIISSNDAETCWNALRYANFALNEKDEVKIFLISKGVEYEKISTEKSSGVKIIHVFFEARKQVFFKAAILLSAVNLLGSFKMSRMTLPLTLYSL